MPISVIQDSAADLASAAAASARSGPVTVEAFLKTSQANAQASLLRTPDQLEVDGKFILKDAGIVFDWPCLHSVVISLSLNSIS